MTISPQQKNEKQRPRCKKSTKGAALMLANQLLANSLRLDPLLVAVVGPIMPSVIYPRDCILLGQLRSFFAAADPTAHEVLDGATTSVISSVPEIVSSLSTAEIFAAVDPIGRGS